MDTTLKHTLSALIREAGMSEILLTLAEITSEDIAPANVTRKRPNCEHKGQKSNSPIGVDSLAAFMRSHNRKWWLPAEIAEQLQRYETLYSSPQSFRATIASNMQKRPELFECDRSVRPQRFRLRAVNS